ncbi:MAG TPA: type VI secretion system protein TssA, partial [Roseateles sp.]
DAVRALQRVCDWIERHEPSNPAPLLIRRAQRLMSKSFLEIMRDLNPEGVHEIEKLAGTTSE